MREAETRKAVRTQYARIAKESGTCCGSRRDDGGSGGKCCSSKIGYSDEEIQSAPEGADLGLGCGNPVAIASLREGEVVLDLGSGAGFDCFLAAQQVGSGGRVIGVDMTPEMIERARENAEKEGRGNVEFRLGEIEHLPVADGSVDVVISNCVINLSPDKEGVFREAFRALKPGGRLMLSDIVLLRPLPEVVRNSVAAHTGCIAGAALKEEYLRAIKGAGFREVEVLDEVRFPLEFFTDDPVAEAAQEELGLSSEVAREVADSVVSVTVRAAKAE